MKKHLMILGALLFATPTQAREIVADDGNEILTFCSNGSPFYDGMCLGYIRGSYAALQFASAVNKGKGLCVPSNVTVGQINDVVIKYIKDHPAERHFDASLLLMMAISQVWPCK